jgi:ribonuclease R
MEDHIGERYTGIISGVCEFGMFVELENTVEGLVRIEDLPGDHYLYNKEQNAMLGRRNKNKFVYGDKVTVEVVKASRETAQVDFIIVKENISNEKKEKENKTKN